MRINLKNLKETFSDFFSNSDIQRFLFFLTCLTITIILWVKHSKNENNDKENITTDNFVVHDFGLNYVYTSNLNYESIPYKVFRKATDNRVSFSQLTEEEKNYFIKTAFDVSYINCYALLESKKYGIADKVYVLEKRSEIKKLFNGEKTIKLTIGNHEINDIFNLRGDEVLPTNLSNHLLSILGVIMTIVTIFSLGYFLHEL